MSENNSWLHFKNLYPVIHVSFTYKKVVMKFAQCVSLSYLKAAIYG
jgi:hypothetical protein